MRPEMISIAGFDPSGGAGILADIKTAETIGAYAYGVVTAITYQDENNFYGLHWLPFDQIRQQLNSIIEKKKIGIAKVGIIENLDVLIQLVVLLKQYNPDIKIIWDPVIKSSTEFTFHQSIDKQKLNELFKQIYLVTPNMPESEMLFEQSVLDSVTAFSRLIKNEKWCNVFLKGGHANASEVIDILVEPGGDKMISSENIGGSGKHGSGCVLSSAIAAYLALGFDLYDACYKAHFYTKKFIASNDTLLGYHTK